MLKVEPNLLNVQQPTLIQWNYEGMLPSRPNFSIGINIFGDIWTSHRSLRFSNTSSRGHIPIFHTLGPLQGLETKLDEHRRATNMFQQTIEYSTQMTNILF
jgi:hypothetical protein